MVNTVTNRQLVFIIFVVITASKLITIPNLIAETVGTDGWITIICTAIIAGVFAVVITSLNNMFQGKMLFDYSIELVGKAGAYIIGIFYALYFLAISIYLSMWLASMIKSNILFKTPQWAVLLAGLLVFGYAVCKSITNMARIIEFYGIILLITVIVLHISMIFMGNVDNILPLFIPSKIGKYFSAIKDTFFSFLGVEILTVIPFTKQNIKKSSRIAFFTLLGIGILYILVAESSFMTISMNELIHYNHPVIAAIRQIEIPNLDIFRRLDIVYLTIGFTGIFASIIAVYAADVEYVCRLLPQINRITIVIFIGVVIYVLALISLNIKNFNDIFTAIFTYIGLVSAVFIPSLLLIIAKVKKHEDKEYN